MSIFKRFSFNSAGLVILVLVVVLIFVVISSSLSQLELTSEQSGLETAKAAVYNAATQCYALEGSYPTDLTYLVDNYGLQLREQQYDYLYESFGGNMPPVIEVVAR